MSYRTLGRSEVLGSELCQGSLIIGEDGARGKKAAEAQQLIDHFRDAGSANIDTANHRYLHQFGSRQPDLHDSILEKYLWRN